MFLCWLPYTSGAKEIQFDEARGLYVREFDISVLFL